MVIHSRLLILVTIGLALGSSLFAPRADALNGDIIELQLDAAEFGKMIRQAIIDEAPCPRRLSCFGDELGPDVSFSSDPCYIDHVDVPDAGEFSFSSDLEDIGVGVGNVVPNVAPIQFVQPTTIFAKSEDCIFDPDCPVNEYVHTVEADLVLGFEFEFDPAELQTLGMDGPAICAVLEDVTGGVSDKERLLLLAAMGQPICQPLPTTSLLALTSNRPLFGAGISLSENLEELAFRFEFDATGDDEVKHFERGAWRTFLEGRLATSRGDGGLGLTIHKDVLINTFEKRLDPSSDPGLTNDGTISSVWTSRGTLGATLEITAPVEVVVDVCPDIDTDLIFTIDFTFDAKKSQMVVDVLVETDMSFWDKTACGLLMGGAGGGPVDWALREALIQVLSGIFTPTTQEKLDESEKDRENGKAGKIPEECVANADDRLHCLFDVDLGRVSFGGAAYAPQQVKAMFGHPDGLILYGKFAAQRAYDTWFLEVDEIPIRWSITNTSCYSGGEVESFAGAVTIRGRGRLCEAPIYHDQYGVYDVEEVDESMAMPKEWIVHVSDLYFDGSSDWQAPYDFEMTVFTTVGSQTIALDAPSYSAAEAASAELEMQIATEVNCTTYAPEGLDNLYGVDTPESLINPWDQVLSPIDEIGSEAAPTAEAVSTQSTTTTSTTTTTKTATKSMFQSGAMMLR